MKASEFRIGNWVNEYGIPIKITPNDILALYQIELAGKIVIDLTPIPLTEEWLVKFGFKERDKKYFIGFNYGRYSVKRVGDVYKHWYLNHEFCKTKRITHNIRYVHQLQNLYFALTGEELKA